MNVDLGDGNGYGNGYGNVDLGDGYGDGDGYDYGDGDGEGDRKSYFFVRSVPSGDVRDSVFSFLKLLEGI